MNSRTIAGWAVVAFVLGFVLVQPLRRLIVHNIGAFLSTAGRGFSMLFSSI